MSHSPLTTVRNLVVVDDCIATAGQPRAYEFTDIRDAGFHVVVNLALPTSTPRLSLEGKTVTSLGMNYVHIPVPWDHPSTRHFEDFVRIMEAQRRRRVFVHCALNRRASAFVFLYRVLHQRVLPEVARDKVDEVWHPNPVWSKFINNQLQLGGIPPVFIPAKRT